MSSRSDAAARTRAQVLTLDRQPPPTAISPNGYATGYALGYDGFGGSPGTAERGYQRGATARASRGGGGCQGCCE
jgi:hypothetical protein